MHAAAWKNLPGATQELAGNLLSANRKSASLAPALALEVPIVLVSSEEYGSLLRDQGEQACQETVQECSANCRQLQAASHMGVDI